MNGKIVDNCIGLFVMECAPLENIQQFWSGTYFDMLLGIKFVFYYSK